MSSSSSIVQAGQGNTAMQVTGLASGLDWSTVIQQLANAERIPETQWETTQGTIGQQNSAFGTISS